MFERFLVFCVLERVPPCGRNLLPLVATSLCICCASVQMEQESLLQRFHRECPFTYEQLYANVDYFCQSHDLPLAAANVFEEDWVHNWEQLADLHEFLVVQGMVDCEAENVANEAYVHKMVEVTSTLCRLIVQNSDVEFRSDATRLSDLRSNAQ